jgi:hypothetical protein
MTATAAQIAQVRRMVNELTTTTYTDATIQGLIEAYPCLDERGQEPYEWDTTTEPPTKDPNEDWIPTYDLAAAAADIWAEKAAVLSQDFDTSADGASLSRSQAYQQAMSQSRHWQSRRKARTVTLFPAPRATEDEWIAN